MAKSRPKAQHQNSKSVLNSTQPTPSKKRKSTPALSPSTLISQATTLLQTGQPDAALTLTQRALVLLSPDPQTPTISALPALSLLGEIYLELGEPAEAASSFIIASTIDPNGSIPESEGGGAEKFLWLAQLCEEGGEDSLRWFGKGIEVLEREISSLDTRTGLTVEARKALVEEKRRKIAAALCGMVEVWMTDLSFDSSAETRCEELITSALLITSEPLPSTLQTLASIRLSQSRLADARSALTRSLELWTHLSPDHPDVPEFATRISLSRLLMEAELEEQAAEVCEGLVAADDESIEAWYLGGWCFYLMALKKKDEGDKRIKLLSASREWLQNSLRLYERLEYEDERLKEHALELVQELNQEVTENGDGVDDGEDEEGVGDWEDPDESDDDDEGMKQREGEKAEGEDKDHDMQGVQSVS